MADRARQKQRDIWYFQAGEFRSDLCI
jgi:hypothetical protein